MERIKNSFFKSIIRLVKKRVRKYRPYKRIIQRHHITYDPEWIVSLYKGEHFICTQLQRRTHVSKGFVIALDKWLADNRNRAIDLDAKDDGTNDGKGVIERIKPPSKKSK